MLAHGRGGVGHRIETFAMLGDTIAAVKTTLQTLVPDESRLGGSEAARQLALTSLAAVWKVSIRQLAEPRWKKIQRRCQKYQVMITQNFASSSWQSTQMFLCHPSGNPTASWWKEFSVISWFMEQFLFTKWERSGRGVSKLFKSPGISKNAEDLLKVVLIDQPVTAASESQVMDKLRAFFVALEYLNICDFTVKAGPLRYMAELEEWRHDNKGLALLLSVDSLIRKKVARLNHDQRKTYGTFSSALVAVLNDHKHLWNDARSSAELDKSRQAQHQAPETPPRNPKRSASEDSVPKKSPKALKNKKRRERRKALVAKARRATSAADPSKKSSDRKPARDERVPASEWQRITAFKCSGKRRCPFYNCSLGCRFGDSYRNAHVSVECGKERPWHGNC